MPRQVLRDVCVSLLVRSLDRFTKCRKDEPLTGGPGIALSVLHENRHPWVLPDALVLECFTIRRKGQEPQALQRCEGHQAGVRLTVTLGSQHSEPVPLKHTQDGVLNVTRFL